MIANCTNIVGSDSAATISTCGEEDRASVSIVFGPLHDLFVASVDLTYTNGTCDSSMVATKAPAALSGPFGPAPVSMPVTAPVGAAPVKAVPVTVAPVEAAPILTIAAIYISNKRKKNVGTKKRQRQRQKRNK
jgi:hypothetical protein